MNYFGWSHVYWNLKVWQKFCPLSLSRNTVSCCTKTNIPSTGCPSCQYFKPLCPMKPARFSIKNDMSELFIGGRLSQILLERKGWLYTGYTYRDASKPSRREASEREKIRRKRGEGKRRKRLWECRSHPYIFSIFPGHISCFGSPQLAFHLVVWKQECHPSFLPTPSPQSPLLPSRPHGPTGAKAFTLSDYPRPAFVGDDCVTSQKYGLGYCLKLWTPLPSLLLQLSFT